jgi:hypothetical protein
MVLGDLVVECLAAPERAVISDHARFNRPTTNRLNHARDDTAMREVHLFNALMGLREYITEGERDYDGTALRMLRREFNEFRFSHEAGVTLSSGDVGF